MTTKKKIWIIGVVVLLLVLTLIIICQPEKETSESIIKIGYTPTAIFAFPLFVAQEKGFFTEQGLEVELKPIEPTIAIPGLLAQEIDYFCFTLTATRSAFQGAPIKIIMALTGSTFLTLIAQPNLTLNDLKTIGIPTWFDPPNYMALRLIEENNLSAEIIAAGSIPGAPALLVSGEVNALIHDVVTAFKLREEGYPILKIFDDQIPQGLTTSDYKIENNPKEVERIVKAIQSGLTFIKNNPQETQELLFNFLKLERNETNQKIVEELHSIFKQKVNETGAPSQEEIETLIKIAKASEYQSFEDVESQIVTQEDVATVFDLRFTK